MKFGSGKRAIVLLLCVAMLMTTQGMTAWARESVDPVETQQTIEPSDTQAGTENQETTVQQDPSVIAPVIGEENTAGSDFVESKSELMKFLVIETSKVVAPAQQNVVVGLNEHSEKILSAKLTYKEKTSGVEKVVDATEITTEALVFQFGFTEKETGAYQISKITYQTEAADFYFDLGLIGNAPEFGVNQDVLVEANGVILEPEQVAQQIQDSAVLDTVITDTDGKALSKTEIQEAVEAASEAPVVTGTDGIIGMNVDESDVQGISSAVLSNEAKEKMIPALKQLDANVPMRAVPLASVTKPVTIVLDPGHGGGDSGVARIYDGATRTERDIVLKISQYCKAELEKYNNVQVYMTRTDNTSPLWDRKQRADYALSVGADILVSIHINSTGNTGTNETASGSLVYVPNDHWKPEISLEGTNVANEILKCLNQLGLKNRGTVVQDSTDGSTYADGSLTDYLGINYYSKLNGFPGIIVEHAFMNNENDYRTYLNTDAKLMNLGVADAVGLAKYYGLVKKVPTTPVITQANRNADGKVVINWLAQEDATFFDIYRYDSIGGTRKFLGEVDGTQTNFTDITADPNQTYYYSIQALTPYGSSLWAKYVQTGSEITSTQSSPNGSVQITYEKATVGTGYYVFRRPVGSSGFTLIGTVGSIESNVYTDTTALPGVRYEYAVAGYTISNGIVYNSSIGSVQVGSNMGVPAINSANREDGKVVVRYGTIPGAISYEIYRSTVVNGAYSYLGGSATQSFTDTTAGNGTYYYKILAVNHECNAYGSSSLSKAVQTGVEITRTKSSPNGQVTIDYEKSSGGTGYYIFRRPVGTTGYTLAGTVGNIQTTSFVDKGTAPGTRYEYAVATYTISAGVVYNSSIGTVKIGTNMGTPAIYSANRVNGKVNVSYGIVPGAISYEIYRSNLVNGFYDYIGCTPNQNFVDASAGTGTYYYKILAVNNECNAIGVSNFSKPVQTGVDILTTKSLPSNQVQITFEKSQNGTGYYLFRKPTGTTNYTLVASISSLYTTSYIDSKAVEGVRYDYAVATYTVLNGVVYNSSVSEVKPGLVMSAPVINSANRESGKVVVRFQPVETAISYEVSRSTSINGAYQYLGCTTTPTFTDTSANGGTYYYKVLAVNNECGAYGVSNASKAVQTGVEITSATSLEDQSVNITWQAATAGSGYNIYRKLASSQTYTVIASINNIQTTQFKDNNIQGEVAYDYMVAPITYANGTVYFGAAGKPYRYDVFGAPSIASANYDNGGIKVVYFGNTRATSYRIYRSSEVDGTYNLLGETVDLEYLDTTAIMGATYFYKVMAVQKVASQQEKVAFSKPVISGNDITAVVSTAPNEIYVSWAQTAGADGYYLFRKTYGGNYQLIATIGDGATYFYDRTASNQTVYTYSVASFKNSSYGLVNSAIAGDKSGGLFSTTTVTGVKLAADEKMQLQMQIDWTEVPGASRYLVCRSTNPDYSFSQIAAVNAGGTCSIFDKTIQLGQTYYYKIIVEQDTLGTTLKSPLSVGKGYSITGNPVMGTTTITVAQMAAHYKVKSTVPYPAAVYGAVDKGSVDTIEKFAQIVIEEANAEGVRAEVVWAQLCNETGFLRFDGDVKAEQCNFAGMGATGGGVPGLTFPNVRTGIRAQVQHLKAYATTLPLNQTCVDPRFSYVPRGGAPFVEWLGIQENPLKKGWAAAPNYGYYLMALVGAVKSY